MSLIEFKNITVEVNAETIFNQFNLDINKGQKLAIELTHNESQLLFDLVSKKIIPTDGKIEFFTDSIMFNRIDDGLYEKMTIKKYLQVFNDLANQQTDIKVTLPIFGLNESMKIGELTTDQAARLKLLRLYLFQPELLFVESSIQELSKPGQQKYLQVINYMRNNDITVIFTATSLEELQLLGTTIYRLSDKHLEKVEVIKPSLRLVSRSEGKTNYFVPAEVDFVESINGISNLSVAGIYYPVTETMDELEQKLIDYDFFRNHRSYLVNLNQIVGITSYSKNSYNVILKNADQTTLPLSRTKITEIKHLLQK